MAAASMTMPGRKADPRDPLADGGAPGAKPKGKGKVLTIVAVLAVLAVGGLAYPKLTHKPTKSIRAVAAAVPDGPIESLDPVTVNLADGHLLQVGVAVQLTQTADPKKVTAMDPRILDSVITTFSSLTYPVLLGTPGHEQARQQLQTRLQELFPPVAGTPQVAAVYFTSFVMQ